MKKALLCIDENRMIAKDTYMMSLLGEFNTAPGRFINIALDGLYLRRPISVYDCTEKRLSVIYKTVGEGTLKMSRMKKGDRLDTLIDLGNGYDLTKSGDTPLLIGGGAGVPPLYWLAKELKKSQKTVKVILGFNSANELFCKDEFSKYADSVLVTTADGTYGIKGFVTDALALAGEYSYVYTCGPLPMLKAVYDNTMMSGQYSFEERMGCGFGACMGCSCKTKYGSKRICKDGPVLEKEEIIW